MITRNEWLSAADAFIDEERARLGGPPTDEERAAYVRGELPDAEMERVRALIVYYDDGSLSEEEKAEDWAAIEASIAAQPKHESWRRWLVPMAAALVVAFLAGRFSRSNDPEPRLHAGGLILESQRTRGVNPEIADLPAEEETFLLEVRLGAAATFPRYRMEVVSIESTPPRTVWSGEVELHSGNTLELSLPHSFLDPGLYRIDVSGLNGSNRETLEKFTVRVH